jgi:hypothetical protein
MRLVADSEYCGDGKCELAKLMYRTVTPHMKDGLRSVEEEMARLDDMAFMAESY